jgi:hypothetical protein
MRASRSRAPPGDLILELGAGPSGYSQFAVTLNPCLF